MRTKCKYSVIIPVYNAEQTIEKCLDSLLHQIPETAELLVINDGSPDGSGVICKRYAQKYPAIWYFEKENGGVSTARNVGLDEAKGEYILFVDSDDYVESNYWQVIDSLTRQHHPDMLQWGFRDCGDTVRERHLGDYAVSGEAAVAEKVDVALRSYMFSALGARAYRRSLIEKQQLRFRPELAIGEDQAFIFSYALGVKKLVSASTILYNAVLENRESLSRKRRDYLTAQLLRVNEVMFQELDKAGVSAQTNRVYQAALAWVHYRSAYSCCKELLKYGLSRKERKKKIKEICNLYAEKQVKAQDMKCRTIAFPVNHQISSIMDLLICRG